MSNALEKLTERAFQLYLQQNMPSDVRVYVPWEMDEPQYPCVIVRIDERETLGETAEHHIHRMLGGRVVLGLEPRKLWQDMTLRENEERLQDAVFEALEVSDLCQQLVNQNVQGVAFSFAHMFRAEQTTENRKLLTVCEIAVIAEPKEAS